MTEDPVLLMITWRCSSRTESGRGGALAAIMWIGAIVGGALLVAAWIGERRTRMDAFAALDRLEHYDPVHPPVLFVASGLVGAVGALVGLGAADLWGAASAGTGFLVAAWVAWLVQWDSYSQLLDAAVVFQGHVPLLDRSAEAFDPQPAPSLASRPLGWTVGLLGALVGGAALLTVAAALRGGWSQDMRAASLGYTSAVGVYFAWQVRNSVRTGRAVRAALSGIARVSTSDVFVLLRRNPRASQLLAAHAARLEADGAHAQALLEFRLAALRSHDSGSFREPVERLREVVGGLEPERFPGALVREPFTRDVVPLLARIGLPPDVCEVGVLDAEALLGVVLASSSPDVVVDIEGRLAEDVRASLRSREFRAPVVERGLGPHFAYRAEDRTRDVLGTLVGDGVWREWKRVRLHDAATVLVEIDGLPAHPRLRVARAYLEREYGELRRAAAIVAVDLGEEGPIPRAEFEKS
ncbi:MAG: hypothetical protein Q8K99_11125 [Actinomycetota bacterium]|nr:hypothetical protein [Actinomycetota bacterium]